MENIFSHVRTQDHAQNFDVQQLSHKLSIAAEIDAVFQRNPNLDRGHIRRDLINARGVDHMNPKSWVGDVCVGNVDIQIEYLAGRKAANDLLESYFIGSGGVNFEKLFSKAEVDHLRPLMGKDYVGSRVQAAVDIIADEDELPLNGRILDSSGRTESTRLASDLENKDDEFEDACNLIDIDEYNGLDIDPENLDSDDLDSDNADLLVQVPETNLVSSLNNLNSSSHGSIKKSNTYYLTVDDVKHYIPTLISKILGSDRNQTKIEPSRLSRVQGIARERALNSSGDQLDATEGKVKSGDLGAVLARIGTQICLVVVEALNFRQGTSKINRTMVDVDDLDADGTKATSVALQFLQLVAHESISDAGNSELTWWWPEQYILIQDNKGGPILPRHLSTRVSGKLFHLLSPNVIYNDINHPIWSISHSDLASTLRQAWEDLEPDSDNIARTIKLLPEISGPAAMQKLPYRLLEDGSLSLFVDPSKIPAELSRVKLGGKERRPCHFCGEVFRISDMRNHVGIHILKSQRNVLDNSIIEGIEVSLVNVPSRLHSKLSDN